MSRINERTLKMKQDFMSLHEAGLGIPEIAKKSNLSVTTVRKYLGEIAIANGVTRESLLEIPHKPHISYERQFEPVKEVDVTLYRQKFDQLKTAGQELKSLISNYIREQEAMYEETAN